MASVAVQYNLAAEEYDLEREQEERSNSSASPSPSASSSSADEMDKVFMLDPSELFRPENKDLSEFRVYSDDLQDEIQQRVRRTYFQMHRNQTVDFVLGQHKKWTKFNHAEMGIMDALKLLNLLIDESDPDSDLPNIVHAFQTAERIRQVHPEQDWFHLTGLIHDLGKVMALWGEEQWAVVGDTFVVGCDWPKSVVYREQSFEGNPDGKDERYNSKFGIYKPNCGLDNVLFSWGHDEYMAQVLMNHKGCSLPKAAIDIIRLHSFYPWHSGGDYEHLCTKTDMEKTMPLINEFNKFDLYTKSEQVPDIDALMPYYQGLIDKYIPGKVKW